MTAAHVVLLFKDIRTAGFKGFFTSAWGAYDTITCIICIISIGLNALLFISGGAITAASQQLVAQSSHPVNPLVNFYLSAETAAIFESVAVVFVFVRCFKFTESVPGIGAHLSDAAAKAAAAAKRMVAAAVVFIVFTFAFASAACAAFGAAVPKWSTVWDAVRTLLTMLFGRSALDPHSFDLESNSLTGGVGANMAIFLASV